jgi:hypothetical protein
MEGHPGTSQVPDGMWKLAARPWIRQRSVQLVNQRITFYSDVADVDLAAVSKRLMEMGLFG